MKPQFLLRFLACLLFAVFLNSGSFAQDTSAQKLPAVVITNTQVNTKVWESFKREFKNAVDPHWFKIGTDYLVRFFAEDQNQSALFNKRGSLIYNITYGKEKHLPTDIRQQVKSVYYDYKITNALSIRESERMIWVVNLEDDKNMLIVRIENGEMEEARHFKKTL